MWELAVLLLLSMTAMCMLETRETLKQYFSFKNNKKSILRKSMKDYQSITNIKEKGLKNSFKELRLM